MSDDDDKTIKPQDLQKGGRFSKGQSGNPKGRPKKAKPVEDSALYFGELPSDKVWREALARPVTVKTSDGPKAMPLGEALINQYQNLAIKGNRIAMERALERKLQFELADAKMADAKMAENVSEFLRGKKAEGQAMLDAARQKGLAPPLVLPHPSDIIFGRKSRRYELQGPYDAEDLEVWKCTGWRLPGKRFEDLVAKTVRNILIDSVALSLALQASGIPATSYGAMIAAIKHRLTETSDERLLKDVVDHVRLENGSMRLRLDLQSLVAQQVEPSRPLMIERLVPIEMKRRGVEMRLNLRSNANGSANVDPILVKVIAKAHVWFDDLASGAVTNIKELAAREGVSPSYIGDLLKLAFLSPRMVEQIIAGQQPAALVADHLIRAHALPLDWDAQEQLLGFA